MTTPAIDFGRRHWPTDALSPRLDAATVDELQQRTGREAQSHAQQLARVREDLDDAALALNSAAVDGPSVLNMSDEEFTTLRERYSEDDGSDAAQWKELAATRDAARGVLTELSAQRTLLRRAAGRDELGATIGAAHLATIQDFFRNNSITDPAVNGPVDVDWDAGRGRPMGPKTAYFRESDRLTFASDRWSDVPHAMSLDLVAHEYSHRVIHKLVPGWADEARAGTQAGAISESLADTFAMAVDRGDWVLGEDVTPGGTRSLADPDLTISDYRYVRGHQDGGQHRMAGIPSAAAYRIGREIGREKLGELYVHTVETYLQPGASFEQLGAAVHQSAVDLYGAGSAEERAVDAAWSHVLERDAAATWPTVQPRD